MKRDREIFLSSLGFFFFFLELSPSFLSKHCLQFSFKSPSFVLPFLLGLFLSLLSPSFFFHFSLSLFFSSFVGGTSLTSGRLLSFSFFAFSFFLSSSFQDSLLFSFLSKVDRSAFLLFLPFVIYLERRALLGKMREDCNKSHPDSGVYTPPSSFPYHPHRFAFLSSFLRKEGRGVYTLGAIVGVLLSLSLLPFFLRAEASFPPSDISGEKSRDFPSSSFSSFSSSSLPLSARNSNTFLTNEDQAPPRRLQAGVYYSEDDRARKGQIYLWVSLTLVGVLILAIFYLLKIASVRNTNGYKIIDTPSS
ncbi:transmembrane protein, partial [Cystoisospora suis]